MRILGMSENTTLQKTPRLALAGWRLLLCQSLTATLTSPGPLEHGGRVNNRKAIIAFPAAFVGDPPYTIDIAMGRVTLKVLAMVVGHVFRMRGFAGEGGPDMQIVSGGLGLRLVHMGMRGLVCLRVPSPHGNRSWKS
jgi:hypothetical protein